MNHNTLGNKKSIGTTVLLVLLALAYFAAKPKLEAWLGTELPGGGQRATEPAESTAKSDSRPTPDILTKVGKNYESAAGLIYGSGKEHRRDHVLRHAKDDLSKPTHGVFDDESQVFALVDEAYEKVKSGSRDVRTSNEGDRTIHTVRMNRRIGYKGGQNGKKNNKPPLNSIRLVLVNENHVITAYPY